MIRQQRRARRRPLQVEALEGKALLSAARPGLAIIQPPAAERATIRAAGPRPAVGRNRVAIQQNDGGLVIEREQFRGRSDEIDYELKVRAGGYRFKQDYELEIDEDDDTVQDGSFTPIDAINFFYQRFFDQASRAVAGGGAAGSRSVRAQQDDGGDTGGVVIERERFRLRGGRTTYKLEFRAGGLEFEQSYTLEVRRDRNGVQDGSFTAADAVGLFLQRLDAQLAGGATAATARLRRG